MPLARRKFDRELEVCEIARRVLSFCRYRPARGHYCYARPSSRPDVLGRRRGLSAVSGCFVFEAVGESEGGALVVLTARQGRGCSLHPAYALARMERGPWRLEWGCLPAAYTYPPATPTVAEDDYYCLALWRRIGQSLPSGRIHSRLTRRRAGF